MVILHLILDSARFQNTYNIRKKAIQNCASAKRRVKQDIVTIPNVTGGTSISIRINSQNWIDPQSLRVGFNFYFVGNPTTYAKFNDDTGVNGIVKSVKVTSNSKTLEFISNYNLLQKIQYSCSVSNDWKQAGCLKDMEVI